LPRPTRWAARWGALAAGALATGVYHKDQFRYLFAYFLTERGDGRFITYICEHWYQSLTGRASLLSPRFFHPVQGVLGYSDALVGYALPYSLLRAFGLEMFSAMQVVTIGFTFLSFLTCFFLLHRVLRLHPFASGAAAFFFAISSPRYLQLDHLQLQFTPLLPLLFAFPILFARDGAASGPRRAFGMLALFVMTFCLQLLTTFCYAWFFSFWSLLFLTACVPFSPARRFLLDLVRGSWRAIAGAVPIALAGALPFLAIHAPAMRATSRFAYRHVVPMIPAAHNFLDMHSQNRIWGAVTERLRENPPPLYIGELHVGIGLIPSLAWIGLTLFALGSAVVLLRSTAENETPPSLRDIDEASGRWFLVAMILATTAFIVIGTKYGDGASLWRYVYALVPGAGAVRAVARYVIFLALPMAVGFAWAIDRTLRWSAGRSRGVAAGTRAAVALLAAFAICEQLGSRRGFFKPVERAYLEGLAADLPADCEAFHLPPWRVGTSMAEHQYDAMMVSILTGVPTLNGTSSQFPRGWNLLAKDREEYEAAVRDWIALEHIEGKVCRLEVARPIESVVAGFAGWDYEPHDFVRRHYLDLLRREPTAGELDARVKTLAACHQGDLTCDPVHLSQEIFDSPEFRGRGEILFRLYLASHGRWPTFDEFRADMVALDQLRASTGSEQDSWLELVRRSLERRDPVARTADSVSAGVADSPERLLERARTELAPDLEDRIAVTLYYFGYLQREPRSGVSVRLERFAVDRDTRAFTSGFIQSAEYEGRIRSLHPMGPW